MISKVSFHSKKPKVILADNLTEAQKADKAWVNYFNSHLFYLKPNEDGDTFTTQDSREEEILTYDQIEEMDKFYDEISRRVDE